MKHLKTLIILFISCHSISAQDSIPFQHYEYMELTAYLKIFKEKEYRINWDYSCKRDSEYEVATIKILRRVQKMTSKLNALNYLAKHKWEIFEIVTYRDNDRRIWYYTLQRKIPIDQAEK